MTVAGSRRSTGRATVFVTEDAAGGALEESAAPATSDDLFISETCPYQIIRCQALFDKTQFRETFPGRRSSHARHQPDLCTSAVHQFSCRRVWIQIEFQVNQIRRPQSTITWHDPRFFHGPVVNDMVYYKITPKREGKCYKFTHHTLWRQLVWQPS